MPPNTPLRSPIRRLALVLAVPCIVFGLADAVRVLVSQKPTLVHADEFTPGFAHQYVTVMGLPHLEATTGYVIEKYSERGYYRTTEVGPFALIPLNVPERSENRVMLAEVPLVEDKIPDDMLDQYRIEFVGLAGEVPEDLQAVIAKKFPAHTTFSRVRVRLGPPRLAASLSFVLFAGLVYLYLLWLARKYERSEDAQRGFAQRISLFFVAIAQPCLLSIMWLRLRLDPEAESIGLIAAGFLLQAFFLSFAFMRRDWLAAGSEDEKEEDSEPVAEELQASGEPQG